MKKIFDAIIMAMFTTQICAMDTANIPANPPATETGAAPAACRKYVKKATLNLGDFHSMTSENPAHQSSSPTPSNASTPVFSDTSTPRMPSSSSDTSTPRMPSSPTPPSTPVQPQAQRKPLHLPRKAASFPTLPETQEN